MRKIFWFIIILGVYAIGVYCGMTPEILALIALIPSYAYDGAILAGTYLYNTPLVAIPLAIGLTAIGFVLYNRHEWHIFDKIRGKTTATTLNVRDEFSNQQLRDQAAALTEKKEVTQ